MSEDSLWQNRNGGCFFLITAFILTFLAGMYVGHLLK